MTEDSQLKMKINTDCVVSSRRSLEKNVLNYVPYTKNPTNCVPHTKSSTNCVPLAKNVDVMNSHPSQSSTHTKHSTRRSKRQHQRQRNCAMSPTFLFFLFFLFLLFLALVPTPSSACVRHAGKLTNQITNRFNVCSYQPWSAWSPCSVTCGPYGMQARTQIASYLTRTFWSHDCMGEIRETRACHGGCFNSDFDDLAPTTACRSGLLRHSI